MFYCDDCGKQFDEPKQLPDWWQGDEHHGGMVQGDTVCPFCESDNIDEMISCNLCGVGIPHNKNLCESCESIIKICVDGAIANIAKLIDADQYDINCEICNYIESL